MSVTSPTGVVRQFVQFAQFNGMKLEAILEPDLFAQVEASLTQEYVSAHVFVDALQKAAQDMHRPDLGLAFAEWTNLRGFGPLSALWDHCGSLGEWITVSDRYLHLENAALGTAIDVDDDEVAMRNFVMISTRYGASQFLQFVMGLEARLARRILGEDWKPIRVEFDHPAPANTRYHRMTFGCPLKFDSEHCSVIVHKSDLAQQSPHSNPQMLAFLERNLMADPGGSNSALVYQVEKLISDKLASGKASLVYIAALLDLSPRSLQRHLVAQGDSFGDILTRTRKRLAEEYFAHTLTPRLIDLADRLGYSDASAASRFLKHEFGLGARHLSHSKTPAKPAPRIPTITQL